MAGARKTYGGVWPKIVTTLENMLLTAGMTVGGKNAPATTATLAAISAYSTRSWPCLSFQNRCTAQYSLCMAVVPPPVLPFTIYIAGDIQNWQ
jgi:hypothetical protein